jgi:hypothetical protein
MSATVNPVKPSTVYPFTRILIAGVVAIGASVAANLVIRWLGLLLVNVPEDFLPLATWQPVVIFTTIFISIATVVWWAVTRWSSNPERTYKVIAVIALILSLIPDLVMLISPGSMPMGTATLGAVMILVTMHIVSAIITVAVLFEVSKA